MSMVSCRKAFSQTLLELAENDKNIFAVATDSRGSVGFGEFAQRFPERFIECGIAEQNACSIAAGLAKTGKKVFIAGPACFLTARSFEQLKVDIAYNKTNVAVVGVSAGLSYGALGGTHTTLHDFAGVRALANMEIFAPCDDIQTAAVTRFLASHDGPAYIRVGRGDVERVFDVGTQTDIHRASILREGKDISLVACGETVATALGAASLLEKDGISARVLGFCSLKPLDGELLIRAARETGAVLSVEEHSVFGGLGEACAHILAESFPVKMKILGLPDEEIKIGSSNELFAYYGLNENGVANAARELLKTR